MQCEHLNVLWKSQTKYLKKQEDLLMKAKWELADIEEERRKQEKERAKMEFRY